MLQSPTLRTIIRLEKERRTLWDISATRRLSYEELARLSTVQAALAEYWPARRAEIGAKKPQA